jgi:CRP/FNR family transcriptional regulator, cyclic AMP receptor protein
MTAPSRDNLFSVLPPALSAGLFRNASTVELGANDLLFAAGAAGDGCYRVDEGLLKVSVEASSGSERILAIVGPGALVGELSMIDGGPRSASVRAIRHARLLFVSRADFDAFIRAHPEAYPYITALLAQRLRSIDESLAATSFLSLKGRVARALLNLADAFGKDVGSGRVLVHQKVSQGDLAAIAGVARENVSRILHEWMRGAVVSKLGGYYCLEDRSALAREATI